jgi:tetratricopeptide (TPR) repeat protein
LAVETNLSVTIERALASSVFLIVVCSPDAAQSRWVDQEIRMFRALHGEGRMLPVIVAGRASESQDDAFPPALRHPDGKQSAPVGGTPVAADLRPGGDGRRMTRLKLIAGMLGVGLDELVRRDAQRRQRQMAAVTGASLAGMAIAASLATAAMLSRNEAVKQRAHAEKERAQADRLVAFMLEDLHKRIAPTGQLDLMEGIARQALKYYAEEDPADLDAASLEKRSAAVNLMGQIEIQRGDLDQAARAFAAASSTTAELLARAPNDGKRVYAHAQSAFWVGEVARQRGDMAKAEVNFRRYLQLAEKLPRLDPQNDDWRGEVGSGWLDLGTLFLQLGRSQEALEAFRQSFAISEILLRRHPDDLDRRMELAACDAWLADSLENLGRLSEARAHRQQELTIYHAILKRDPRIQQAEVNSVVAEQALAQLDLIAGNVPRALAGLEAAAARAVRLTASEPDDMDIASVAAVAEVRLGEALMAAHRLQDAQAASRKAEAPLAAALAKNPSVTSWRRYADEAALLRATLAASGGDPSAALLLDEDTLLSARTSRAMDSNDRWILDRARLQTGDDLAALHRNGEARVKWLAVADDLATPSDGYEPRLLLVLAGADARLGRTAQSRAILRRLARQSHPEPRARHDLAP